MPASSTFDKLYIVLMLRKLHEARPFRTILDVGVGGCRPLRQLHAVMPEVLCRTLPQDGSRWPVPRDAATP